MLYLVELMDNFFDVCPECGDNYFYPKRVAGAIVEAVNKQDAVKLASGIIFRELEKEIPAHMAMYDRNTARYKITEIREGGYIRL